jgi:hypothetical protein
LKVFSPSGWQYVNVCQVREIAEREKGRKRRAHGEICLVNQNILDERRQSESDPSRIHQTNTQTKLQSHTLRAMWRPCPPFLFRRRNFNPHAIPSGVGAAEQKITIRHLPADIWSRWRRTSGGGDSAHRRSDNGRRRPASAS